MKQLYKLFSTLKKNSKGQKLALGLVLLSGFLSGPLFSQASYTFTPAGQTGSAGPTSLHTSTAYAATNLNGSVTVAGGIQSFTIVNAGNYKIEAWGAAGGTQLFSPGFPGGKGVYLSGNFTFTAGTVLKIIVGQMGMNTQGVPVANAAPGGGGGSFVYFNASNPLPLIAAGGGAGGGGTNNALMHAVVTQTGNPSMTGALGGVNGNGGQINVGTNSYWAGGGAGWLTDGTGGNNATNYNYLAGSTAANGGRTPLNGALGGTRWNDGVDEGGDGGFGGGGGGGSANMGTGGGGGFSGGGGANWGNPLLNYTGGGGGSYNGGTSPVNTASVNAGQGKVVITELCNITLTASGTNSLGAICSGQSVTLTTNGVSNYLWSTGATGTNAIVVAPTITTTYTLSATSPSACTASNLITIIVDPAPPTLTVANTASATSGICPSKTVALTASGATTYTWTGGSTTVTNGVVFTPTASWTYTVEGSNACGTTSAMTSVSIHPVPSVTAVASTPSLCSGLNLTLTGVSSPTATFAWSGGPIAITNGVGFAPSSTQTYSVIGTSALTCTTMATTSVVVVTTPSLAPIANPTVICVGSSGTLTASGAANYTWTSPSTTSTTNTFNSATTPPGSTTYTITKSNSNCVDTKMITVTVLSLTPVLAIVNPATVCASTQATLFAGGGISYTWTAPGPPSYTFTGANPPVNPAASTIYSLAAYDGTCINTTTVQLFTKPNPTLNVVPSATAICYGNPVTLTVTGGVNYTWTSVTATLNTPVITDSPTASIVYNVVGDNTVNCTANSSQIIIVHMNPTVTAVTSPVTKTLVCSGGTVTLSAGGAHTYSWDPGANSALTATTIVSPSVTTMYTVTGTNTLTTCFSTKSISVTVFSPTMTVTQPTNTCDGGTMTLTASGANNNSYNWNTGGGFTNQFQTIVVTPTILTTYTVSALSTSNAVTCPHTKTTSVGIFYNPTITAMPSRTNIVCRGEFIDLIGQGGVSYSWSNAMSGATITIGPVTSNQTLTVIGTDGNACSNTATVVVKTSACTGVNEIVDNENNLLVYPNPNNGEFNIRSDKAINLRLVNELGQTVRMISLTEATHYEVSVKDLAKGIYFVTGKSGSTTVHYKVVVTK